MHIYNAIKLFVSLKFINAFHFTNHILFAVSRNWKQTRCLSYESRFRMSTRSRFQSMRLLNCNAGKPIFQFERRQNESNLFSYTHVNYAKVDQVYTNYCSLLRVFFFSSLLCNISVSFCFRVNIDVYDKWSFIHICTLWLTVCAVLNYLFQNPTEHKFN